MEPHIQYATTKDGVSIAYTSLGNGPTVVYPAVLWGDIAFYQSGVRHYAPAAVDYLAESGRSITIYDGRGTGLSDREPADFSADARLSDLEAVIDALGPASIDLVGRVQGTAAAISYAVKYPGRIRHLVLWNPFARGPDYYAATAFTRAIRAFATAAIDDWAFVTLTVANWALGFSDPDEARATAATLREGMEYETYLKALEDSYALDVSELLPRVSVPTLVIRDTGQEVAAAPQLAKQLASRIPGAQFVTVNGMLAAASAIVDFTSDDGDHGALPSGMTAILFLDIAGSTELTTKLGDAAYRGKERQLDGALREAIRAAGGSPVEGKVLGDGVMATFVSAKDAIDAALACQSLGDGADMLLHAGIHAGDVIREENNVHGGAVQVAARIAAASVPGEVLVSQTVRDLARTSAGVSFEDRGERELKGVSEAVQVYAVREQA